MPLSEHEQRQLEQIEQALYREDRRLARLVRSNDPRVHYRRRVVVALVGLVLGVAMVVVGIILPHMIGLAAAGFAILLLSGIWALNNWRQMATVSTSQVPRAPSGNRRPRRKGVVKGVVKGRAPRGTMMERLDERWRRRQERGGF